MNLPNFPILPNLDKKFIFYTKYVKYWTQNILNSDLKYPKIK